MSEHHHWLSTPSQDAIDSITEFLLRALDDALGQATCGDRYEASAYFIIDLVPNQVQLLPTTTASIVRTFWELLPPDPTKVDPTTLDAKSRAKVLLALRLVQVSRLKLTHLAFGSSAHELLAMPGACRACLERAGRAAELAGSTDSNGASTGVAVARDSLSKAPLGNDASARAIQGDRLGR